MKNPANLKNVYTEQTNKLQHKHQQECELLEDLRLFSKQRSIIEKEYAQSLTKLAQQFLTKRSLSTAVAATEDGKPKRTGRSMHEVWVTVLEETEKVGKIRLQASEVYMQQISEACKPIRTVKMQVAKKVFENLAELQKDLAVSVADVTKLHKLYKDEEHLAHDARSKAADADDKVKKKSVGIFTSMSKLQQQSAKLMTRKDACQVKSTTARNDYLLSLAAIKSHVNRYYNYDMPEIIKAMDGDIYECMQEYFTAFCQAELNSCGVTQECFMRILADSTKVNRDFQLNCFLKENPIFTEVVQYNFQPTDNDQVMKVSLDHQCKSAIEAEAHKWACKFVSDDRELRVAQRKLQRLLNQGNIMTNMDSTEPATSTSVIDQQTKKKKVPTATLR